MQYVVGYADCNPSPNTALNTSADLSSTSEPPHVPTFYHWLAATLWPPTLHPILTQLFSVMPALLLHSQAVSVPQHIKNCNNNFVLDDMIFYICWGYTETD